MYKLLEENKVILVYIPLVVYWIFIFILTSIPLGAFNEIFAFSDKIKHFGAYCVLSVLLSLALHFQSKIEKISVKYIFYTSIFVLIYATADELHQIFIPSRSADILDWVADFFGMMFGLLIASKLIVKNRKRFSGNKFGNQVL